MKANDLVDNSEWKPEIGQMVEWRDLEDGEWRWGVYEGEQENGFHKIRFDTVSGSVRQIENSNMTSYLPPFDANQVIGVKTVNGENSRRAMKTAADFLDEEFVTMAPDEDKTPIYAPDCYQLAVHADRIKKVMQAYAREAIAEHLERAANEATIRLDKDEYCEIDWVDRDSIRNIEIILK